MLSIRSAFLAIMILVTTQVSQAQFLMDMIDTSKEMGRGMLSMYSRFDKLRIGGYIQPQFQAAQSPGAKSFEGGDFQAHSGSRFMLRRSRIRVDYIRANANEPVAMQFVFQFDATERGVFVRDVWARIFENRFQRFSFTTGVFARPFGYELNLSSADRESPERGRMSQTLMKVERDLGAMVSLAPRLSTDPLRHIRIDAGLFNGQGLNAPGDYDSFKDFISRIGITPVTLAPRLTFSAGASLLSGGIYQNSVYRYEYGGQGNPGMKVDSSQANIGRKAPRHYYGADAQLRFMNGRGFTEIRGEYWWGTQTGSANSSETPPVLLALAEGYYVRSFNGAFFYLLQHLGSIHHQVGIKYDWYDPNTHFAGSRVGRPGSQTTPADIKYSTLHAGYNYYMNENLKLMFWYALVRNEATSLAGYTADLKDNIFTCRLQYRF